MKFMKLLKFSFKIMFFIGAASLLVFAQGSDKEKVKVKIISDEADCVMNILDLKNDSLTITESDWQKLSNSEGYIRLKKREEAMKRAFTDSDFKSFVFSDTLYKKRSAMRETLERWKSVDIGSPADRAMAYLPEGSVLAAKIYIEIKPKSNSFVFDMATDPAIFLYLNPEVSKEKFENTLAHELHHIGFAYNCEKTFESGIASVPENVKNAIEWICAFGEGFAMIAAAGGPDIHPHAVSSKTEKERWDKDMLNFNKDLKLVEMFFLEIINGKLKDNAIADKGMEFFGIQGPWYTVGWKMSMVIEKIYGHNKLMECICNPRLLLAVYNSAVSEYNKRYNENLAEWSESLIKRIGR